jgi:hypothetical protein
MSKLTNPETEQSVTCGFYNSLNDRKYDAVQMSRIFDGIIKDGIFASIGTCFAVNASTGLTITVGVGKCWFNHTWTENDAILPVECEESEVLLDRIDAVVIEVNSTESVRDNFIKVVKGTPSSNPVRPTMVNDNSVHQHALCYIYRKAGSTEIKQSDITSVIGTNETPFVTGILQTVSLDVLLGQWEDDLNRFVASEKLEVDTFMAKEEAEIDKFMRAQKNEYDEWYAEMVQLMSDAVTEINTWTDNQKNTILSWFDTMKGQLSSDAAANLQIQINDHEVKNILMFGLPDGEKTFSDDGTIITSIDSSGRKLVKTFTNNFLTCTTILFDSFGGSIGTLVKNFSSDGKTITSDISIHW